MDTLQNSIDVILTRLTNSSSVLRTAPAVEGQVSFSLLQEDADFLTLLRLHVQPNTPLSLTQNGQVLSFGCNAHMKEEIQALSQPLTTKMHVDMQIEASNRQEAFFTKELQKLQLLGHASQHHRRA